MKKYYLAILFSVCIRFAFGQLGDLGTSFHIGTGFQSVVTATAIQPDNKILVGGDFTSYNGTNFPKMVRLFPNGSIDSTFYIGSSGFSSTINSIKILADSTMLVAGEFTYLNSINLNTTIVKLTKSGAIDPSFNASTNINGAITAMEVDTATGKIYIGGIFTTVCGQTRKHIARLIPNGNIDNTFDVGTGFTGSFAQSPPYCIKILADGSLLVGGDFMFYNGVLANKFCKITSSSAIDNVFTANITGGGFNGIVRTMDVLNDGKIIVGGSFTSALSFPYNKLTCLNSNGSINTSFNIGDGISGTVYAIKTTPNNKILVGGGFNFYNNVSQMSIIQLNPDGSKDANFVNGSGMFSTSFSPDVYCINIQADSNIVVGGEFTKYKDSLSKNLVRIIGKGVSVLSLPTLTTSTPLMITNNSAQLVGKVTDDGNSSILSQGVCWSTTPNPTVLDNFKTAANDTGAYHVFVYALSDSTVYYTRAYATNSEGTGYGNERTFTTRSNANYTCGNVTFNYNGASVTYGTVKGFEGRCWLDRTLGAERTAETIYDNPANGDLFQWGRQADGHQLRTSGTTNVLSPNSTPSNGDFILPLALPFNWMSTPNNNLWSNANAPNNPCPSGWRLPTMGEFVNEISLWPSADIDGAFQSVLRLHAAGMRSYESGTIVNVGGTGLYWTSEANDDTWALGVVVEDTTGQITRAYKATGGSVRCIKDYTDNIQIIDVNKAFQIYPNPANNLLNVQFASDVTSNSVVTIYDNTGRLVLSQPISTQNERIDISQIPAGIYFVKVQNKQIQHTERLVIIR